MISRRLVLAAACLVAILPSTGAFSFESQPFTPQAFETAQQSGNQILVEIHAPWCPICKAQGPILSDLLADAKRKDMKVFRIDFDSQKADVRKLRAQSQSTLIVFKGTSEVGRSVGDTNRKSVAALLDKAI